MAPRTRYYAFPSLNTAVYEYPDVAAEAMQHLHKFGVDTSMDLHVLPEFDNALVAIDREYEGNVAGAAWLIGAFEIFDDDNLASIRDILERWIDPRCIEGYSDVFEDLDHARDLVPWLFEHPDAATWTTLEQVEQWIQDRAQRWR